MEENMNNSDLPEPQPLPPGFQPNFDDDCSDNEEQEMINTEDNKLESIRRPPPPKSFPPHVSVPVNDLHENFIRDVFNALVEEGLFFNEEDSRKQSPFEYKNRQDLAETIDFELSETGTSHEDLLKIIRQIVKYSPHPGHPFFMDQRSAGLDPYGIVADMVSTSFNNNAVLYIIAPSYSLMETEVIRSVSILVGYSPPDCKPESVEGIITPGGALGHTYAFSVATNRKMPKIKECGIFGEKRPIVFVSEAIQYAFNKGAIMQGFGLQSVVPIRCNPNGKMDINDLRFRIEESKAKGDEPVMVVATAGTPILRAFDPIEEIADVAKEYDLWLHVDGTWGGACLLSESKKYKLKGIERSDSFIWSQHFILSAPFTSAVLVLKPTYLGSLYSTLGLKEEADYAFNPTPLYDTKYDLGNRHIQTSRRPEIFKFWFMWKAKGISGLGKHVDYIFDNAKFCVEEIKKRKNTFKLVLDEFEGTNVSFVYIPPTLRGLNKFSKDYKEKINQVAPTLQSLLLKDGIMSIATHKLPKTPNFLTFALHNSAVTQQDIVYLLNQIENYGQSCAQLTWKWSSEGLYQ